MFAAWACSTSASRAACCSCRSSAHSRGPGRCEHSTSHSATGPRLGSHVVYAMLGRCSWRSRVWTMASRGACRSTGGSRCSGPSHARSLLRVRRFRRATFSWTPGHPLHLSRSHRGSHAPGSAAALQCKCAMPPWPFDIRAEQRGAAEACASPSPRVSSPTGPGVRLRTVDGRTRASPFSYD